MKLCCTVVLIALLVGCGSSSRTVRLDTGRTDTFVFTPRTGAEPVELDDDEFNESVAKLARDARLPTRPQEAARRLFEVDASSGSFTYETRHHRITALGAGEHLEVSTEEEALTRAYLVLLALPDVTVSKGIAAVMTAALIAYGGVDTFWGLVVGFKRLMDEADRAITFHALRAAGERYGKLMGRNAARAFAMLALAAIGHTAPGLATKVQTLPGEVMPRRGTNMPSSTPRHFWNYGRGEMPGEMPSRCC